MLRAGHERRRWRRTHRHWKVVYAFSMRAQRRCMRRSGFTLIELLVVLAVIAILSAMLFPVYAQSREKSRQTTCLSNIHNLGIAMLMYAQDADEHFPLAAYATGPFDYF